MDERVDEQVEGNYRSPESLSPQATPSHWVEPVTVHGWVVKACALLLASQMSNSEQHVP